jgi:uncharacterized membrane protein
MVGILSVNVHTLCIAMRTGRMWVVVWQLSRVHRTCAVAREWGECFGEHVDQDPPG